jgi:hypothetical protein
LIELSDDGSVRDKSLSNIGQFRTEKQRDGRAVFVHGRAAGSVSSATRISILSHPRLDTT